MNGDERIRILPVLGYHRFGDDGPDGWYTWFRVPAATFEAQMQVLRAGGWQPITAGELLAALDDPNALPQRAVLITIDDAFRSVHDIALPCLVRCAFPAILFVPTAFIGGRNEFDRGWEPPERLCDWTHLRTLAGNGVSIQSHGVSHRPFSQLTLHQQEIELRQSRETLQEGVGQPVCMLAFPYGDAGKEEAALDELLAERGYRAACLFAGGWNSMPPAQPFRLARIPVGPDTELETVLPRIAG